MSLQQVQSAFMAFLHDPEAALPAGWDAAMRRGLEVHRNNYQSALLESMRDTYARTRRWVGESPFDAAAAHHLVCHPPSGWTLDDAGSGFPETLASLFTRDPEVSDLAGLEWAMHRVSIAEDASALDRERFRGGTAHFGDDDWAAMRLQPIPGLEIITVQTDCVALWRSLAGDDRPLGPPRLEAPHAAIVWREGWRPVCCLAEAWQAQALHLAVAGVPFGELCQTLAGHHGSDNAPAEAGRLLGWWIDAGMLAGAQ